MIPNEINALMGQEGKPRASGDDPPDTPPAAHGTP